MYVLKRRGKVVSVNGQIFFGSYEEARQAARRKIRQLVAKGKVSRDDGTVGWMDSISRGPTKITGLFKIVRT